MTGHSVFNLILHLVKTTSLSKNPKAREIQVKTIQRCMMTYTLSSEKETWEKWLLVVPTNIPECMLVSRHTRYLQLTLALLTPPPALNFSSSWISLWPVSSSYTTLSFGHTISWCPLLAPSPLCPVSLFSPFFSYTALLLFLYSHWPVQSPGHVQSMTLSPCYGFF